MRDYYGVVNIANGTSPPENTTLMVQSLQAGARTHWWPTLLQLRRAKRLDHSHQALLDLWKGFGAVLGLDAKQERQRY